MNSFLFVNMPLSSIPSSFLFNFQQMTMETKQVITILLIAYLVCYSAEAGVECPPKAFTYPSPASPVPAAHPSHPQSQPQQPQQQPQPQPHPHPQQPQPQPQPHPHPQQPQPQPQPHPHPHPHPHPQSQEHQPQPQPQPQSHPHPHPQTEQPHPKAQIQGADNTQNGHPSLVPKPVTNMISAAIGANPILQQICSKTDHPDLCLSTIPKYLVGGNIDPISCLEALIKGALDKTKEALAKAQDISGDTFTNRLEASIMTSCLNNYADVIDELNTVLEAIPSRDIGKIESFLSGAITYAATCSDSFSEMEGMKNPLRSVEDEITNLVNICLVITDRVIQW